MNSFDSFNLSTALRTAISDLDFKIPTPVQTAVIPILLEGRRNMVALAQTGTGKTAAFGIPVLQRIDTSLSNVQTVILCPTRELCLQVCRDIKLLARHTTGIRTVAIYGGASIEMQLKALHNGVHIIVATPGRLHDILRRRRVDLSTAACVVLDEADEMLSMGFEEDLNAIMAAIPPGVQKLLFSATMPRQVAALAAAYMADAVEITIGNRNAGAENVFHECYMIHEKDRYAALKRIVDFYPEVYGLIFCRTRVETQEIAAKLIQDGYSADALHGDLSQAQRDRVMDAFRNRALRMLVATDVAARGLDISSLSHVINYQLPDDLESYTHRSGRTGRAGKAGASVVLINMREKWKLQHIEKRIGKRFECKTIPSGREVCEAQLCHLASKVKALQIDERQIKPFIGRILEMLDGISREEIIHRFISYEFNSLLEYYRNTPDLQSTTWGKNTPRIPETTPQRARFAPRKTLHPPRSGSVPARHASAANAPSPNPRRPHPPKPKKDSRAPAWARNIKKQHNS